MLAEFLRWTLIAAGTFLVLGSCLSLSNHPHWFIRGWDFPRLQIAGLLLICSFAALGLLEGAFLYSFLAACGIVFAWHVYEILPYTRLHPVQVKTVRHVPQGSTFRLITSNVLMSNLEHDLWRDVLLAEDPDIILAAEVDQRWANALEPLREKYPHVISRPQDNMYGMMLLSRLKLVNPEVRYIVQDDVPSFHTGVQLPNGALFNLRCVHPRPPEPLRDRDSKPRDAELVLIGREVDKTREPTVVSGDLNDVAWSHTTRLFQRIAGMLDPRVGRGFFNSYHARHRLLRWPLDHVFHTEHFELVQLRRLSYVGSDHFPIFIELAHLPREGQSEQEPPRDDEEDRDEAGELINRARSHA